MSLFDYPPVIKPHALSVDSPATIQTVDARTEVSIKTIEGVGFADIWFHGDGGTTLQMRVYADGRMIDEIPANTPKGVAVSFTRSLEIRVYNPGEIAVTESSSGFKIGGALYILI